MQLTNTLRSLLLLIVMVGASVLAANAQNPAIKFDKVEEEWVRMSTYDKNPDATALVLYDFGNVEIKYSQSAGFQIYYDRHTRIKIFNKEAYDVANVEIPYYEGSNSNREKIIDIKGATYVYENGQVKKYKLEKSSIFDERKSKNVGIKKFAMPNVQEGAVIEYTYRMVSDFLFTLPAWIFQSEHPTLWSEYRLSIPEYFEYANFSQVYDRFDVQENDKKRNSITLSEKERSEGRVVSSTTTYSNVDYTSVVNRWVMENVPPFKAEKFVASYKDCINRMEFQLSAVRMPNSIPKHFSNTWDKLAEELRQEESYGKIVASKGQVSDLVKRIIQGQTTDQGKMQAIYNYVKENYQYNGRNSIYAQNSMKDILQQKKAGSADINLLMTAMMKAAGLEAYPVLLSTRRNGKINPNYPILSKFNYNVVYVSIGEEEHLLDATDKLRPINMLPIYALNGEGLLLTDKGSPDWINLQNRYKVSSTMMGNCNILPDGTIEGQLSLGMTGYEALELRRKLLKNAEESGAATSPSSDDDDDEEEEVSELTQYSNAEFTNLKDYDQPLKGSMKLQTKAHSSANEQFIYLTPLLGFAEKKNHFTEKERKFPVDFSCPYAQNLIFIYTIPDGYEVEELPPSLRLALPDKSISCDYLTAHNGNQIQVSCKLNVNKATFSTQEYEVLREIFTKIIGKNNEQIVLKKK